MAIKLFRSGHHPDYTILALIFVLVAFGLIMLASASSELGKIRFNDTYYYLKQQLYRGLIPGLVLFFLASKIHYKHYQKFALLFLALSLVILFLVFTDFGYRAGGAGRWLQLGPITFQPSEILKITYILYLAAWLSNSKLGRERKFFEGLLPFLVITGIVGGMLLMQPATSTVAILVASGFIVYFLSGAKWRYIFAMGGIAAIVFGLVTIFTPYRLTRITSLFNYENDPQKTGYHLREALITIGSGQIFGLGYGQSFSKTNRLPAPISDSIFAVIASELGFIGAGSLAALFGFLTIKIFLLARNFRDRFGKFLLLGYGSIIGLQAFVNMAAISGILPITGIPLPFVSSGGTALVVFLAMAGVIVNISKYS